jgi:hypothetical protein
MRPSFSCSSPESVEYSLHTTEFHKLEASTKLQNHLIGHALKERSRDTGWAIRKDNSKDIPKDLEKQRS